MSHASALIALNPTEDIEGEVQYQMEPFDENGTCFRDGSRWDWWTIGGRYSGRFLGQDHIRKGELKKDSLRAARIESFTSSYREAAREVSQDVRFPVDLVYGFDPRVISLEDYLKPIQEGGGWFPATFAFLRERHWHEGERLGWFGSTTATECELANPDASVEEMIRRCKYKDPETGASIVVWNEPWEVWAKQFYHRFVEPLPEETVLVVVDYHV